MGAGASKNKITSHDKAVLDLKVQRDKLKKYQKNVNCLASFPLFLISQLKRLI